MSMRRSHARSRLISLLAFLAMAGQLAVSVIAPLADARAGRDAPAHVEAQGIAAHYAHDETSCVACVASTMLSRAPVSPPAAVAILRHAEIPPVAEPSGAPCLYPLQASPRAPPLAA